MSEVARFKFDPMSANRNVTLTVKIEVSRLHRWRHWIQTVLGLALIKLGAWVAQIGMKVEEK